MESVSPINRILDVQALGTDLDWPAGASQGCGTAGRCGSRRHGLLVGYKQTSHNDDE